MTVKTATKIIENALASYIENDIASDTREIARTEKAWRAMKGAIAVAVALVNVVADQPRDTRVPEIGGYDPELDVG